MINSLLDNFIDNLEDTYGKYKSGMRTQIRIKLENLNEEGYDLLFTRLTQNYDMARPPSLKVILTEIYINKIPLNMIEYVGVSVCEFCKYEYSQNLVRCPKCQKLRKYGISKITRMKDGFREPPKLDPTPEEQEEVKQLLAKVGGLRGLMNQAIKRDQLCQMKI